MRILILGGSGMLGHRLWMKLGEHHETWVTIRTAAFPFPLRAEFPRERVLAHVDALDFDEVTRALASIQPDLVINCIGLIKQTSRANDPVSALQLNALLPHRVALICRTARIRMIHISTDCVFSGRKGNYAEGEISDAEDLYGRTKYLGEVDYSHVVTLRTSIIGRELKSRLGLIEWFLAQKGTIHGYQRAIYSGFSTDELARIILDRVIPSPGLSGIHNVSSEPISKHDLLALAKAAFKHPVEILPDTAFVCDRSLDSSRFRSLTGYTPPSWPEMIEELAFSSSFYEVLRNDG